MPSFHSGFVMTVSKALNGDAKIESALLRSFASITDEPPPETTKEPVELLTDVALTYFEHLSSQPFISKTRLCANLKLAKTEYACGNRWLS